MVGLIENEKHITTAGFKAAGDVILLVGDLVDAGTPDQGLGASHFAKVVHGRKAGRVPSLDFTREKAVQTAVLALIRTSLVKSAHDCSEGGIAVALAESCFSGREKPVGATVDLGTGATAEVLLFGEAQSRILLTVSGPNASAAIFLLEQHRVPVRRIGTVGGDELTIAASGQNLAWPLAELQDAWTGSIPAAMES
jgi:phosphoribosylformylglycinamidine synthase